MQFMPFDSKIEVSGASLGAILDGFGAFTSVAEQFMLTHKLGVKTKSGFHLDRQAWYPQQSWLDAYAEIAAKVGGNTLFKVGLHVPEHANLPPFADAHEALAALDIGYHMNHRRSGTVMFDPVKKTMLEGIGHYQYKKMGDRLVHMVCDNPYPCDFDRGVISGLIQRFYKRGVPMKVNHDTTQPCRKRARDLEATGCTYVVQL